MIWRTDKPTEEVIVAKLSARFCCGKSRYALLYLGTVKHLGTSYQCYLEDGEEIPDSAIVEWASLKEEEVTEDLEKAADEYAEKHGFRIPYNGSNNYYDDVDVEASKEGFIEGALWKEKQYFKAGINATARPDDMELWANLDGLHLEDGDSVRVVVIKSPKDVEKLKEK